MTHDVSSHFFHPPHLLDASSAAPASARGMNSAASSTARALLTNASVSAPALYAAATVHAGHKRQGCLISDHGAHQTQVLQRCLIALTFAGRMDQRPPTASLEAAQLPAARGRIAQLAASRCRRTLQHHVVCNKRAECGCVLQREVVHWIDCERWHRVARLGMAHLITNN